MEEENRESILKVPININPQNSTVGKVDNIKFTALLLTLFLFIGVIIWGLIRVEPGSGLKQVSVKLEYDSIPKQIINSTVEKPVVIKPGEVNIPSPIINLTHTTDTALLRQVLHEVLVRYYQEIVQHTTTADTNIIIDTWDTLTQNSIKGRKLQYKWLRPTEINTKVIPEDRFRLYRYSFKCICTSSFLWW